MKKQIALSVVLISLLAGCATHRARTWEYKVLSGYGVEALQPAINKAAAEGWEVVSAAHDDARGPFIVLRRATR